MERRDQLAERRRASGYSQEGLAEAIGVTSTTVARWERGAAEPLAEVRKPLARALHVSLERLNRILLGEDDEADDSDPEGNSRQGVHRLVPDWLSVFVSMEQSASLLEAYEPHFVSPLLQTNDYARAILQESENLNRNRDRIERLVELRMNRQKALARAEDPLDLHVTLSEAVLRLQVGGRVTMRAQLEHLLDMTDLPNLKLYVLPFTSGPHTADRGAFALLSFPWETAPSVVYHESYTGGASYVETQDEIDRFTSLLQRVRSLALPPDESKELIQQIAKGRTA